MRRLTVLAVFLVGLAALTPLAASAAHGTASARLKMGTVNINAAGGSNFAMAVHPIVFACEQFAADGSCAVPEPQQKLWNDLLWSAQVTYPGQPLDVYTIGCWRFTVGTMTSSISTDLIHWICASADSGPATTLASTLAQTATGTLGTTNAQCSWLGAYDPVVPAASNSECDSLTADYNSIKPGVYSPTVSTDMMPDLDPYVGQTVNFQIITNWCSYIAPPGFNVAEHNGYDYYDNTVSNNTGCADQEYATGVALTSFGGSSRTLASAKSGNPLIHVIKLHVAASAYDCHVPRVKGLTLLKARARLHRAHCSIGYIYHAQRKHHSKSKLVHVLYQPLKVGTGRPKGYGVTLTVGR